VDESMVMDKRRLSAHGLQQLHLPLALLIAGLLFMVWASGSLSFFRAELDGISGRDAESYRQSYGQTHPVAHAAVDSAARSDAAASTLSPTSLPVLTSCTPLTPTPLTPTPLSPTPLSPATCFAPSREMRLQQQQLQQALRYLQQHAATARRWYIELPQPRQPFLRVRWQDSNTASAKFTAPAPLQLRTLDPWTGLDLSAGKDDHAGAVQQDIRPADPTAMALGSMFFQLHYQAHGWLGPYGGRVIAALSVLYVLLAVGGLLYWRRGRQRQGYHSHRSHGEQSHDYRLQSGWRVWHRRLALLTLPFCLLWLATGVATLMFAFNSAPITLLYSPAMSNKTVLSSQSATQPVTAQPSKSSTTANRAATIPASGGSADFYQQLFPATSMQFAGVAASSMATSAVSTPFAEVYPKDLLAAPPTRTLTTAVIDERDEQWQRRWQRIWLELWQHLAVVDDEAMNQAINKAQRHHPSIHPNIIHKVTIDRPSDLDATLLFTAWPQQLWQHQHSLLLRWQDAAVLAHTDPRRGAWQMLRARLLNVHQAHIWPLWVNAVLASFAMAACAMLYCGMRLWYQQLGLSYARARQHRQHLHTATLQAQKRDAQKREAQNSAKNSHPPHSAWRSGLWQQRLAWGWICLCCHGFAMAALLLILLSQSPLWPWLMALQGMSADRLFACAWLLLSFGFALQPPALTPPTKPPQIKPS
jgi:hypothetical protein